MKQLSSCLYAGQLLHRRYLPKRHSLNYRVINLFVDVDELAAISEKSWLFGYNRKSLFSIQDRNHGPGDGTAIAAHVRELMDNMPNARPVSRIFMFCYPAVLGRIFNPLTVYFGYASDGAMAAVVYEVNNTFGQRHSYALPVDGEVSHKTAKRFYVSPFNPAQGEYRFDSMIEPDHLRVNIALFESSALKLCARFEGQRKILSDAMLLGSALSLVVQPVKIIAAIHWEALKLYVKGLRPQPRPPHARYAVTLPEVQK